MSPIRRDDAVALDRADPLGSFRSRFVIDPDGPIYLDGNSLGRLPRDTVEAVRHTVETGWGAGLVESWERWIDLPQRAGAKLAPLLGASPEDVTLADSTSVNLYRLAAAAADALPERSVILTDRDNFPTDRYVLEGLAAERGLTVRLVETDPIEGVTPVAVAAAMDGRVAFASFSLVSYRSAAFADMAAVNEVVHSGGGLTLWDLSHAAGSVPVDLAGSGADLAVGCTYKYLSGGPGAPAFLFVRPALQGALQPPVWGWFAHEDQFGFHPGFRPAPGMRGYLVGTPPVIAVAAALPGIELVAEAGIERIRSKSMQATGFLIELIDTRLAPFGVTLGSPRDPQRRGSHVALQHPDGLAVSRWLRTERRVVTDFRAPDTIRMAVAPLSTGFSELWDAVEAMADGLSTGAYRRPAERPRVT